jgi:hypothetical protein
MRVDEFIGAEAFPASFTLVAISVFISAIGACSLDEPVGQE